MPKTAAEINAARIEAILRDIFWPLSASSAACREMILCQDASRKIVEAFPELRPPQFTSERDGTSRIVATPLPWLDR